jgi:hypothetical protein
LTHALLLLLITLPFQPLRVDQTQLMLWPQMVDEASRAVRLWHESDPPTPGDALPHHMRASLRCRARRSRTSEFERGFVLAMWPIEGVLPGRQVEARMRQ